jgi:hypothetical protein
MYFQQTKLSKAEWEHCEVPVSLEEKKILHLIRDGYYNINIKYNDNQTILQHMKLEYTPEIEVYLYMKYFKPLIDKMTDKHVLTPEMSSFVNTNFSKTKTLKKNDLIRLSNLETNFEKHSKNIYEFVILDFCKYVFLLNMEKYTPKNKNTDTLKDKPTDTLKNKTTDTLKNKNTDTLKNKNTYKKHAPTEPLPPPPYGDNNKRIAGANSIGDDRIFRNGMEENIKIADKPISYYLYNIIQLNKIHLSGTIPANKWVMSFISCIINQYIEDTDKSRILIKEIFNNSPDYIERNPFILKYANRELYDHQKQLYSVFNQPETPYSSRLVFYTAPTGTGKTLSPLGLSNQYRVIYICASRHIGLAFAKNAISVEKKVAFAFGCETADDIRLHYYSAKDYEINRKSGGIFKVDNANGERVEIMICDLSSYLVAMYYMLSFNDEKQCILYWDEPTISLDIPEEKASQHPLHTIIHEIWKNNKISNIVFSCATLPTENELIDVVEDYSMKFDNTEIHTINSYECAKTISLIDKDKYTVLPHFFFENHADLMACVRNCRTNRSILRYFNLKEIVEFIQLVTRRNAITSPLLDVAEYFQRVEDLTMNGVKIYYLMVLSSFGQEEWSDVYKMARANRRTYWCMSDTSLYENVGLKKVNSLDRGGKTNTPPDSSAPLTRLMSLQTVARTLSHSTDSATKCGNCVSGVSSNTSTDGIHLSTTDAHTLTDGVTIFFAEDVEKIGRFLIYQSKIPESVLSSISDKIRNNEKNYEQIETLAKEIENRIGKDFSKERKMGKDGLNPEIERMMDILNGLKEGIRTVALSQQYIPNTPTHQSIWWNAEEVVANAFVPNVDQSTVEEVMGLDVTLQMKMLLLMGIGVFIEQSNNKYMEIMKRLATEQRLYLIIASCDFIYGMNYQMCHAFFGKDLKEMTQQKIIQAIGRVGRGNIQQEYTIRIRDDDILRKLFLPQESNIEAVNMCRLFSSV